MFDGSVIFAGRPSTIEIHREREREREREKRLEGQKH
jgi:hypothetical protein